MKAMPVVVLGLMLGTALAGCSREGDKAATDTTATRETTTTTTTTTPTPGTNAVMSNSELENAVKAKLQSDEQLRAANIKVDANADKKEITLSGTVPSQDLRTRALELAKAAQAGLVVNDKIDVKPAA